MTLARATRLLALGVLTSLLVAAGPGVVLFGLVAAMALATAGMGGGAIFRLPRWVFRALTMPVADGAPAARAAIARAWWAQPQG